MRQKVAHLDNLLQIKDSRIAELLKHMKRMSIQPNVPKSSGDHNSNLSCSGRSGDRSSSSINLDDDL